MGKYTKISWCHHTHNPWLGCTKVSTGCANCYAEALMDKRWGKVNWGTGNPRKRTSESNWKQPLKWNREAEAAGERRRVFCASLADVFDEEVSDEWRHDLFNLIAECRNLDWLVLTKRTTKMREWFRQAGGNLPNVWLGVSVENQKTADERIPELVAAPAAVRFVSYEPAIEAVDFGEHLAQPASYRMLSRFFGTKGFDKSGSQPEQEKRIPDWIIVGGESGPGARPFNVQWARDTVRQCKDAEVAVFVKQLGAHPCFRLEDEEGLGNMVPSYHHSHGDLFCKKLNDKKGGDWDEWPAELRIREFPTRKKVTK